VRYNIFFINKEDEITPVADDNWFLTMTNTWK
jgi:hypothetical protein